MSCRQVLTILAVRDFARAVKFYTQAFNWKQTVDVPAYAEFELPDGMRLGVYGWEAFGRNAGQVPFAIPEGELTATELYFYCDDLAADIRRLIDAGAQKLSELQPRDWGDEAAYFKDPEGNVIVLAKKAGSD